MARTSKLVAPDKDIQSITDGLLKFKIAVTRMTNSGCMPGNTWMICEGIEDPYDDYFRVDQKKYEMWLQSLCVTISKVIKKYTTLYPSLYYLNLCSPIFVQELRAMDIEQFEDLILDSWDIHFLAWEWKHRY